MCSDSEGRSHFGSESLLCTWLRAALGAMVSAEAKRRAAKARGQPAPAAPPPKAKSEKVSVPSKPTSAGEKKKQTGTKTKTCEGKAEPQAPAKASVAPGEKKAVSQDCPDKSVNLKVERYYRTKLKHYNKKELC